METPRKVVDAAFVTRRTHEALHHVKHYVDMARKLTTDPDQERRLQQLNCAPCHYISRMAGQAFTKWHCGVCGKEGMHHNTATPAVCNECAKEHDLCGRCGGDREMRPGRRKFPLPSK